MELDKEFFIAQTEVLRGCYSEGTLKEKQIFQSQERVKEHQFLLKSSLVYMKIVNMLCTESCGKHLEVKNNAKQN